MTRGIAGVLRTGERAGLAGLAALAGLVLHGGPSMAADAPRIQIVFDGSGSMWGKIPGDAGAKYTLAREALRQKLPALDRTAQVGLVLFGHRRRGDCGDIEQAVAPQAADKGRLVAPLETLNPKGRGPLALALVAAADALPGSGANDSLILVHDDPDNCQGDPCATATELKRVRPRLVVHVVSIGMKPEDLQRMACVPRITSGQHFDAQDAAAVAPAIGEALRLASLATPAGPPIAVPRPVEATRQPERGPPGLRLSVALADGGEPLGGPTEWRILRAESPSEPVIEITEAAPSISLPPGSYIVEARRDFVEQKLAVEVGASRPTRAVVVLNAGIVQLSDPPFVGNGYGNPAVISLEERREGGAARVLWVGPAQAKELVVPAGTYRVVLQDGQFRTERMIVVPSGSKGAPPLGVGTGRIRLDARDNAEAGDPAGLVLFQVLEDDPAAPGGRREVARSAAISPQFTLPAGTYHLVARKGPAEVRELIALRPGDDVSRTLGLRLAQLSLSARVPGPSPSAADKASWRVLRLDGTDQVVAHTSALALTLQLPAGRYRVEARLGGLNAVASQEVELTEAGHRELTLAPEAGLLQLRLAAAGGGHAGGDVFWEVRDGSGHVIWRTTDAEPREFLAAGRYVIRAETRERRVEKAVDVSAGEARTLEMTIE